MALSREKIIQPQLVTQEMPPHCAVGKGACLWLIGRVTHVKKVGKVGF